MNVENAGAGSVLQLAATRQQSHHVQDLFSDVLEAAGRRGYASARPLEQPLQGVAGVAGAEGATDAPPVGEQLATAWEDWFQTVRSERYSTTARPEDLKRGYGQILTRAHAEGGYVQPKEFLNGLSRDELRVVQDVHHLADPIRVGELTEEGALNLLLPPPAQVDLNHDGLTQSGAGYGLRFPDSNTPAPVAAAWEESTAGMGLGERMTFEFQMVSQVLLANFHLDEGGAYSHHDEPGDPGFVNPMADPAYSYAQAARDRLDALDFMKEQMPIEQYERQTDFWNRLRELYDEAGVG